MTSSEIFLRGTFCGQRYRKMYDQKPWPGLALNEEFSKGRSLNQKLKMKKCKLVDVFKQTSLTQTYHRWRSGVKAPTAWQFFCNF